MNKELRCAIYKKKIYYNKFLQNKSDVNWEVHVYRKQWNLVTKIKKNSIKTNFFERTAGGPKSSTFYSTIKNKPFLSNNGIKSNNNIILFENEKIVNDPKEVHVSEIFNNFFINVAKDIGDENINTVLPRSTWTVGNDEK